MRAGVVPMQPPNQNDCIETNVNTAGGVVKKKGRFVKGDDVFPDGLLEGNTIYEVVNSKDFNVADGCGSNYVPGRLYRDQRYARAFGGLRKKSTQRRHRKRKTLKRRRV